MNHLFKKLVVVLLFINGFIAHSQTLTISSNGDVGPTSGPNWSINNGQLYYTANANVQASVITSALANGSLTIQAATNDVSVIVDQDIITTSNNSGITIGNINSIGIVTFNRTIDIYGAITVYADKINMGANLITTGNSAQLLTRVASGHISLFAKNGFETLANSNCERGKIHPIAGGNLHISADADNNNTGILNIDWLTLDGSNADILMEGAVLNWNTGSSCALPEIYSTGGTLTIRNTTSSNYEIQTQWFAMLGTFAAVTLGREGVTEPVLLNSCTVCASTALNFGTSAFQIAGPISVYGGNINANFNLRSTNSGSDILLKATKHIIIGENVVVQTNNGDITFWSNSDGVDNVTDGDFIGLYSGVSINSANGLTNQTTGGGTITMAGGNTSQVLPSGTIVPTGYAYSSRTTSWVVPVATLPPGGINFGEKKSAENGINTVNVYSGGGDIVIKGKSSSSSAGIQWFSGSTGATQVINSGNGTVTIDGLATSTDAHGIEFMSYASVVHPTIISSNTSSAAISIKGETLSTNLRSGYQGTVILIANGNGGGIEVNGKVPSASNYGAIEAGSLNAYALSGPITFISEGGLGLSVGGTWGKGTLASSSSDITLRSDRIPIYPATTETTGTITVEPLGTSFASAVTFPITNLTIPSTVSGLTIGKSTNTANITFANATTIAGPINVYGAELRVQHNLTSTGSGSNILLKGSGRVDLSDNRTITTNGGDVTLWADADNDGDGFIRTRLNTGISTSGGNIILGGGTNITTGFAKGHSAFDKTTEPTFDLRIAGIHLMSGTNLSSAGGNIILRGQNFNASDNVMSFGVIGVNTTVNAGAGKVSIVGNARGSGSLNAQAVSHYSNGWTIRSSNTDADAIFIEGDATATTNSATSMAINFVGTIEATGNGGGISIIGNSGSTTGTPIGASISGNVLAASGPISISGSASDNSVRLIDATLGSKTGTNVTASSSNITLTGNQLTFSNTSAVNSSGSLTLEPLGVAFTNAITFPLANLTLNAAVTGLIIGKPTNTANVTFANATSIAGPITVYSGTITLDANITTTNGGDISLFTDNPLGGLTTARTLTAGGAFKYIPRTTTFSADVTYPITNLTATSTGLTIGNATNDKNITINADVSGGAGIELYGNNVNINSNLTTTGTSAIMYLKGNTTIAAGKTITSGGNFTHDGNLTFKSDVNGTAAFGRLGGSFTKVSGTATVERYIPAKRAWRLLTAPLKGSANTTVPNNWQGVNDEGLLLFSPATYQNQTMTGYTTGGGMPNIWKYNSTNNTWLSIPNITDENLFTSTVNNGFLVFATGASNSTNIASGADITTLKPKGDLISGDVTHALIADKYHLIGNPYASPLNTMAMAQANAGTKIWLIDPGLNAVGGYFTYDGTNWAPTTPSGSDAYIQSGQGFFVRKDAAATTFTISESHKITGNTNDWFGKASSDVSSNEETSVDKIRVLLYKQINNEWQLADGILAVNSFSGNNEVDATDTGKMTNFNENIAFRNGDSNLSIEYRAIPTTETIQLMRLTGTNAQPYQIRVKAEHYSNSNLQPYLQDTQLGALTEIPTDGSELIVNFNGIAATAANPDARFSIVYPIPLSTNSPNELTVRVYPNPVDAGEFNLSLTDLNHPAKYTLTNILGQQVQEGTLDKIQNTVSVSTLQAGVYMIQIEQAHKKFVSKLIIK